MIKLAENISIISLVARKGLGRMMPSTQKPWKGAENMKPRPSPRCPRRAATFLMRRVADCKTLPDFRRAIRDNEWVDRLSRLMRSKGQEDTASKMEWAVLEKLDELTRSESFDRTEYHRMLARFRPLLAAG